MAINDPTITVTCDKCGEETNPMEMCALAGGEWDERYIKPKLERRGWKFDGDNAICEMCATPEE